MFLEGRVGNWACQNCVFLRQCSLENRLVWGTLNFKSVFVVPMCGSFDGVRKKSSTACGLETAFPSPECLSTDFCEMEPEKRSPSQKNQKKPCHPKKRKLMKNAKFNHFRASCEVSLAAKNITGSGAYPEGIIAQVFEHQANRRLVVALPQSAILISPLWQDGHLWLDLYLMETEHVRIGCIQGPVVNLIG